VNILSIFGGPRKKGNTATVLNWVEEELRSAGHQVERIGTSGLSVAGCSGCWACAEVTDAPGCVIDDYAQPIFSKMIAADCILFASPLYSWGFAAQIKPLIDRCVCLVTGYGEPEYASLIANKRSGLIVTCGGQLEGNANLIQGIYKHIVEYYGLVSAKELIVPNCTEPDQLSEEVKGQARAFAHQLVV